MASGKNRKRRHQGRKPRGAQHTGYGSDLGSVGERDSTLNWIRDPGMELPDLAEGGEVSIVIAPPDGPVPDGAGALLGTLSKEGRASSGTPIPAGSRIYRSTREMTTAEIEADPDHEVITLGDGAPMLVAKQELADKLSLALPVTPERVREAEASIIQPGATGQITMGAPGGTGKDRPLADFASRIAEVAPGLAAKLAAGLSGDELRTMGPDIARAMHAAGAERGAYSFSNPGPLPPGTGVRPEAADRMAAQLAGGRSPELIVTDDLDALDAADVDVVIEDLDPDDPDSGRVLVGSAAQVRRYHQRARELDAKASRMFGSPGKVVTDEAKADLIPLRGSWTADEVIGHHAWLTQHYQHPSAHLADYLAYLMRVHMEESPLAASLFYPVDLDHGPADSPEGAHLAQVVAGGLADAETFQVTAPMCRVMRDTWEQDRAEIARLPLDAGELPVPAGFAWLDKPWLIREDGGYWLPVRAVSWQRVIIMMRRGDGFPEPGEAARFSIWLSVDDLAPFGHWDAPRRADQVRSQLGQLILHRALVLPFDVNAARTNRSSLSGMLGLLHTLWAYLGMELPRSSPVTSQAPAVKRRVQKSLKHDRVHIITLRKYDYIGDRPAAFPKRVNWTCRWWVEKFWRHIDRYDDEDETGARRRHKPVPALRTGVVYDDDHDVCSVCLARDQVVRITEVHGFMKGPPGKPIRIPAKDRTLSRLSR